jgi:hypothetical protein
MAGRTPNGIAKRVRRDLGLVRPLGLTRDGALYYAVNLSMTDVFTVSLDPTSGHVISTPKPVASRFVGNHLRQTVGDTRELWRISKEGTGLQPAGLEAERQNLYFLRISQDGRRMAFVMGDYDVRPLEVWVMEHFLQ